ncbi:MAG: ECF transporter S component [Lachnospira sp.]|nr:ECF transporter S component [Lachnospira sp.]
MKEQSKKTRDMVMTAMFTAIIIIMAFVPYMGYIPLGFMNATIIHIPVIIGAIVLGPKKGAFLGGVFGITSMINNTINPNLTSFVFSPFYNLGETHGNFFSIIICMVPRILIGVVAYYVYKGVMKLFKNKKHANIPACAVAGVAGSLTNTILVMGGIALLFGESYAAAKGLAMDALYGVILGVVGTNGVPEAIVAGIIVTLVCKALFVVMKRN